MFEVSWTNMKKKYCPLYTLIRYPFNNPISLGGGGGSIHQASTLHMKESSNTSATLLGINHIWQLKILKLNLRSKRMSKSMF